MQISPISCRRSANRAPPIRFSVVNCQLKRERTHGPCVPTCVSSFFNLTHFVRWNGWDCAVKWVRLSCKMAVIGTQVVSYWLSMWLTWRVTRMHVGTLTLNFEHWTLTFRIGKHWTLNLELWPLWLVLLLRWFVSKRHVGTHGSCVRAKRYVHSFQQPRYLLGIHIARTHEPMYIDLHS